MSTTSPQQRHDLTLGIRLGHLAVPRVPGHAAIRSSSLRSAVLAMRGSPADRQRHLDRQGSDDRQQPGRPAVLRQPALAQVSLLGMVYLVLQRRRAPRPQQGAAASPDHSETGPARCGRRRRRVSRLAARRLANRRRRHLAFSARGLPPPRRRPIGLARSGRSRRPPARESALRRRPFDRSLQLLQ